MMNIDAAIRTAKYDYESGTSKDNRTPGEQSARDMAMAAINAALNDGTYAEARERVAREDNWAVHFPAENRE